MITLEQLEEMFSDIAAKGRWDMTKPMLWGYFFTDSSPHKLNAVAPELEQLGYGLVDVFEAGVDPGTEPYYFLHVEKVEVHSPASLHARNQDFYEFASKHGLQSYDGMDVGLPAET
ncbi:MAG: ribonuclease E inhibitor RraB [Vitreoscilla sp.]|nr:ribonuclease E inhibitor RraB [Vitreoscilla sp.]